MPARKYTAYKRTFISFAGGVLIICTFPSHAMAQGMGGIDLGGIFNQFIGKLINVVVNIASDVIRGGRPDQALIRGLKNIGTGLVNSAIDGVCSSYGSSSMACKGARIAGKGLRAAVNGRLNPETLFSMATNVGSELTKQSMNAALTSTRNASRSTAPRDQSRSFSPGSTFTYAISTQLRNAALVSNQLGIDAFTNGTETIVQEFQNEIKDEKDGYTKEYNDIVGNLSGSNLLSEVDKGLNQVMIESKNEFNSYRGIAQILAAHAKVSVAGHQYLSAAIQHQAIFNARLSRNQAVLYQFLLENQAETNGYLQRISSTMSQPIPPSTRSVIPILSKTDGINE